MKNLLLLLFVIAVCWKLLGGDRPVVLGPGVEISDEPTQTTIVKAESFDFKSYQITPLASLVIKAKVLSKNGHLKGRESDLSPIDLALGWKNV